MINYYCTVWICSVEDETIRNIFWDEDSGLFENVFSFRILFFFVLLSLLV